MNLLSILGPITGIINKVVPDRAEATRLNAEIQRMLIENEGGVQNTIREIAVKEASGNWFQSSWRPLISYLLIYMWLHNILLVDLFDLTTIPWEHLGQFTGIWSAIYGFGRTIEKSGGIGNILGKRK